MFETKNIPAAASVKDIDGKKGIITGYFAHFNNEDSDGDIIIPGAFAKTIRERGPESTRPRVKHLRNHLIYEPIGVLQVLKEDAIGLYYESKPGTHFIGQDSIKMIESGLITEHSFGFETVKQQVIAEGEDDWLRAGRKRILQELKLWEGSSLTGFGANEMTGPATIKSKDKDNYIKMISNRQKALEKFCHNTDATDETIELLLIECKQLSQFILDFSQQTTEPEPTSTLPGIVETIQNFRSQSNSQQNGLFTGTYQTIGGPKS